MAPIENSRDHPAIGIKSFPVFRLFLGSWDVFAHAYETKGDRCGVHMSGNSGILFMKFHEIYDQIFAESAEEAYLLPIPRRECNPVLVLCQEWMRCGLVF